MMHTNSTAADADMQASAVMLAFAPPVAHDTPISWCPTCQQAHRIDAHGRRLCLRHRYVRTLVRRLNDALIDGSSPTVDDIVRRVAPPACLRDGGDDERATRAWGLACLRAYRDFLRGQQFACIIDSRRHVQRLARPLANHSSAIAFAGSIDLAAIRVDGTVSCLSLTLDPLLIVSSDQYEAASALRCRAAHVYGTDSVEVIVMTLPFGRWWSTRSVGGPR